MREMVLSHNYCLLKVASWSDTVLVAMQVQAEETKARMFSS